MSAKSEKQHNSLQKRITKELNEELERERSYRDKYAEEAKSEYSAKASIPDGILAGLARSACEKRAKEAEFERDKAAFAISWISDMLKKY
jgi:hypothetical protein